MFYNDKKQINLEAICGPVTYKRNKPTAAAVPLPAITSSSMSHTAKKATDDDLEQENNPNKDIASSHEIKDHLDRIRVPRKIVDLEEDALIQKEESLKRLAKLVRK